MKGEILAPERGLLTKSFVFSRVTRNGLKTYPFCLIPELPNYSVIFQTLT
jgi:hypothetical protein